MGGPAQIAHGRVQFSKQGVKGIYSEREIASCYIYLLRACICLQSIYQRHDVHDYDVVHD